MLTPTQIKQLVELVKEADIDVRSIDTVYEYIGLLLEDISGFECITDGELTKIQAYALSALKNR